MTKINQIAWDDTILPFQLDRSGVRGRIARLDGTLEHILSRHHYPTAVGGLVAELALLTALIGQTMKLRWKLSLQVRGSGAIRTLATDYYAPEAEGEPARIRAWASFDAERLDESAPAFEQIGDGYFAVLIDQGPGNTPYQGLTPLAGGSLASCAQTYFAQSEQLPTRFSLEHGLSQIAGDAPRWRAGGVMLQTLPAQPMPEGEGGSGEGGLIQSADILQGVESEDWNRANFLLDTVETMELIGPSVAPTDLLVRLFHEEEPRIFDPQAVKFGCTCTEDKVRNTMSIYSQKDITHMTTEAGIVTADCQFCGAHYELDPKSLGFEATIDAEGNPLPPKDSAPHGGAVDHGTPQQGAAH
ncbi:Hsp33 family molecular chaperone HslO [Paracoccus aminophilus]|uniref:Chaperone Hsp33 n=1 Tax=Paracoccus aminophilus JCM 7686 TaxID=1367847 RepID=S5YEW5_PARAH|nr:Hsp33 family molecular chaperone HslO [Paracoccus aminophilus]AGT10013.1 chaperone Hsp33 [Paracoccus aminophilus JCM 7686]